MLAILLGPSPSFPTWAADQIATLKLRRDKARTAGHNVDQVGFSCHNNQVLAAANTGAYHFRFGPSGNVTMRCLGHPSAVLESIVYGRV